jgi:hypothetical protein
VRQTNSQGRKATHQKHVFAPIDGALIDRLSRLISGRGQSKPTADKEQSSEAASLVVPTLQDMLQRRS